MPPHQAYFSSSLGTAVLVHTPLSVMYLQVEQLREQNAELRERVMLCVKAVTLLVEPMLVLQVALLWKQNAELRERVIKACRSDPV